MMLKEELQLLQEPGSYVGEVFKVMGKSKVLVKVPSYCLHNIEWVVIISYSREDMGESLTRSCRLQQMNHLMYRLQLPKRQSSSIIRKADNIWKYEERKVGGPP
ncbi:26S protease regulatory subunit 8 [Artemisia annua]|uniref:26S protease regulatory subunit 8 n=1 Tax=Artemisia annua TaxID=35608 RepID=A0A2U1LVQ6_ARTAN|nr:26S protease regulatory subunit 8 [Artemisia annua]